MYNKTVLKKSLICGGITSTATKFNNSEATFLLKGRDVAFLLLFLFSIMYILINADVDTKKRTNEFATNDETEQEVMHCGRNEG